MPYLSEVILENFQSHAHTVLKFSSGFNSIVGKTRSGKTSIVRAMMFMYFDEWSESFIRKGASHVIITFKFDDGTSVIRSKGGVVNKIVILRQDGTTQMFEKFGVEAPPEVKDLLKVRPVRIDVDKFVNINISDQDAPPFLLSETAPAKTKYLNRLTGAHILDTALRTLNKDKLTHGAVQANCLETLKKLRKDAEKCSKLPVLKQRFSEQRAQYINVLNQLAELKRLSGVQADLLALQTRSVDISKNNASVLIALQGTAEIKYRFKYIIDMNKLKALHDRALALRASIETTTQTLNELNELLTICPTCGAAGVKETFTL